jgi:hypothetical protein
MRSVLTAFLLLIVVSCAHAADVELTRVWPAWRSAESFERISEYFDGQENTGRHTVLRTQPNARAGYYFLIRAKAAANTTGAKFVLQIITPEAPEPKTHTFPITLGPKEAVFDIGLTGTDWAGRKTHAVAWRLSVVNAEGRELASQQSFLWSNPAP